MKHLIFLSAELMSPGVNASAVPESVRLFGYGKTRYFKDGKIAEYVFCEADADRLIADFVRDGVDIPTDYNHQQLRAAQNGKPAPASGWIVALEKQADGLYAQIKWTETAAAMIAAKEYRYTSPTFYQTDSGQVAEFYNLSLTNKPATIGCPALVAAEKEPSDITDPNQGVPMKGVLTLLGLSADAPESVIHDKVKPLLDVDAAAAKLLETLREPLALSNDDAVGTPDKLNTVTGLVLALAERAKSADASAARVVELEKGIRDRKIDDALAKKLLTNAQLEWAKDQTLEQLEKFLEKASPVVPESKTPPAPNRESGGGESQAAASIRAKFGHSPEDLAKYNK